MPGEANTWEACTSLDCYAHGAANRRLERARTVAVELEQRVAALEALCSQHLSGSWPWYEYRVAFGDLPADTPFEGLAITATPGAVWVAPLPPRTRAQRYRRALRAGLSAVGRSARRARQRVLRQKPGVWQEIGHTTEEPPALQAACPACGATPQWPLVLSNGHELKSYCPSCGHKWEGDTHA